MAVSGTPITEMSARNFDDGIGLGEAEHREPPGSSGARSLSQVCGFIATIMSTPPRAPRWPSSVTRTSYQVGRPWMLEGKTLRGDTGTPWRRIERANISLALAEPEPLTLAKRTTKSFTLLIGSWTGMMNTRGACR